MSPQSALSVSASMGYLNILSTCVPPFFFPQPNCLTLSFVTEIPGHFEGLITCLTLDAKCSKPTVMKCPSILLCFNRSLLQVFKMPAIPLSLALSPSLSLFLFLSISVSSLFHLICKCHISMCLLDSRQVPWEYMSGGGGVVVGGGCHGNRRLGC